MKKTVNLIRIIVMILIVMSLLIGGYFFTRHHSNNEKTVEEDQKDTTNIEILKLDSISAIEEFIKGKEMFLQTSDDEHLYSLGDVKIENQLVRLYFQTDENGNFTRVDGNFSVELESNDVSFVQKAWSEFCNVVVDFFDIEMISGDIDYNIYVSEGYEIDNYSEESFEKILKSEAKFSLSAIDVDGTYWNASAYMTENGMLRFEFFHFYERGVYENGSANIVLFESSESEAK